MVHLGTWENSYDDTFGKYHIITINYKKINSPQDLIETIIHELIHAKLSEKNIDTGHTKYFQEYVDKFAQHGYNVM